MLSVCQGLKWSVLLFLKAISTPDSHLVNEFKGNNLKQFWKMQEISEYLKQLL